MGMGQCGFSRRDAGLFRFTCNELLRIIPTRRACVLTFVTKAVCKWLEADMMADKEEIA